MKKKRGRFRPFVVFSLSFFSPVLRERVGGRLPLASRKRHARRCAARDPRRAPATSEKKMEKRQRRDETDPKKNDSGHFCPATVGGVYTVRARNLRAGVRRGDPDSKPDHAQWDLNQVFNNSTEHALPFRNRWPRRIFSSRFTKF